MLVKWKPMRKALCVQITFTVASVVSLLFSLLALSINSLRSLMLPLYDTLAGPDHGLFKKRGLRD